MTGKGSRLRKWAYFVMLLIIGLLIGLTKLSAPLHEAAHVLVARGSGVRAEIAGWYSTIMDSIQKEETSIQEAARKRAITLSEPEDQSERFLMEAEITLRTRPKDEKVLREEQIKKSKQKISDLVMDIDNVQEAAKRQTPALGTSEQQGWRYRLLT